MRAEILAAIVGGVAGLIVSLLGHWLGPRNERALERLKAKLEGDIEEKRSNLQSQIEQLNGDIEEKNSAAAARRDYEYDARKRLYEQVEPLLFQIYESLEEAHYRVRSLARTSRGGNLGSGKGSWIARRGYYLYSTIYKVILPAAHFRQLQSQITFVDLELDGRIWIRYMLLKLYVRSFTDDFNFARLHPGLRYDPDSSDGLRPAERCRQGLVLGDLENIAESMIVPERTSRRAMSFAEFENLLESSPGESSMQELVSLFYGFSPEEKPVLARLLIAQSCFSQLLLSSYHAPDLTPEWLKDEFRRITASHELAEHLAWHQGVDAEIRVAEGYWLERLDWLASREPWSRNDGSRER